MIFDSFSEVYVSMSRNKLRIALTGFSIAWGIFMLIVLLGAGNGLMNGMMTQFGGRSVNRVTLWPGYASEASYGLPKYRSVNLDVTDLELLRDRFPQQIDEIQPVFSASVLASVGTDYQSSSMEGIYPSYVQSSGYQIVAGRSLNEMDIRERRKVFLMCDKDAEKLLGSASESVIGTWVKMYGLPFQLVGIFHTQDRYQNSPLLAPITTVGTIYKPNGYYSEMRMIVKNLETKEANEDFNKTLRELLAKKHRYDPSDRSCIYIWNAYEDYVQAKSIFAGLQLFIWLIGIATLIAGVTGISNIMLITVRERTHEFGIRKALGARPRQIIALVLLESVAITLVFGYAGLFFGIGLTQLVDFILQMAAQTSESEMPFQNPTVDLPIVMAATLVMVVAGIIAGYVPAKRAVSVKPVEALAAS
jgi:putative ABC transport system permease protein